MKIEISVIIPFYDNFELLKRAVNSVLNQSFKKFEIIIIYDNPQNKENLYSLKNFIYKKKIIKIIVNNNNLGAGLSRNKGIKVAKGKFIAFLDSDDFWKKNKLFIQYNFMKKNNLKASHTSYDLVDLDGKFIQQRKALDLNYSNLINSCDIGLSTVMIKNKLIFNKFLFPNLKTKEDYVLWLKIAKKGVTFHAINKPLTRWTKRSNSLSSSVYQKLKDAFSVYYVYERLNFIKTLIKVAILSINFIKKK